MIYLTASGLTPVGSSIHLHTNNTQNNTTDTKQYILGCWQVPSPTRKETSYRDRRFWFSYILFIIIIGGILVLFIYIKQD